MAEQSESFSEQIQLHESEGDSGLQQTTLTVLVVSSSKKTHDIKEWIHGQWRTLVQIKDASTIKCLFFFRKDVPDRKRRW